MKRYRLSVTALCFIINLMGSSFVVRAQPLSEGCVSLNVRSYVSADPTGMNNNLPGFFTLAEGDSVLFSPYIKNQVGQYSVSVFEETQQKISPAEKPIDISSSWTYTAPADGNYRFDLSSPSTTAKKLSLSVRCFPGIPQTGATVLTSGSIAVVTGQNVNLLSSPGPAGVVLTDLPPGSYLTLTVEGLTVKGTLYYRVHGGFLQGWIKALSESGQPVLTLHSASAAAGQVLRLGKNQPTAKNLLAWAYAYYNQQLFKNALVDLKDAIKLDPRTSPLIACWRWISTGWEAMRMLFPP